MAKRIFISFAVEDKSLRDLLVGQARNSSTPFEFVDMSVKEPWDSSWKTNCRIKIKGCDGVLAIVTKSTRSASGQLWEMKCAKEEYIPRQGIWGDKRNKPLFLPQELVGTRIVDWTWDNIASWIRSL